jgi:multidrug efflux pump subunit AcrB
VIITEIGLSIIGVLLGYTFFRMEFVILMTGIGIVGLAGIVVKNGILLVEFTDELRGRGYKLKRALIEAGKIRLTPVILTAASAILGLIPMAIGFNIDFVGLFRDFEPHIHLGGDNVAFWGPLSWTIIFGLSFATFLTLLLVPAMYYRGHIIKLRLRKRLNRMNYKRGVMPANLINWAAPVETLVK